ncbi:uncharacterized protein VTP21DRAFT_6366 [Calcarisporiella thermophila]|uniref:uncharacterized protein n=1 Tax=Calcarisporiella thermophila TaxID=911321 RepID=UPI003744A179
MLRIILRSCLQARSKGNSCIAIRASSQLVGTPDPSSNLRPVRYFTPENELPEEKEWRLQRERVDRFNHGFWAENNALFESQLESFKAQVKESKGEVTSEDLSRFYKDFLDRSYQRHMEYNRQWWRENITMLVPGFRALVREWKERGRKTTDYFQKNAT